VSIVSPTLLGAWFPISGVDYFFVLDVVLLIAGLLLSRRWPYATIACYFAISISVLFGHDQTYVVFLGTITLPIVGGIGFVATLLGAIAALRAGRIDMLAVVPIAVISYYSVDRFAGFQASWSLGEPSTGLDPHRFIIVTSITVAGVAAFFLVAGIRELRAQRKANPDQN
jgi:hypothetical protein